MNLCGCCASRSLIDAALQHTQVQCGGAVGALSCRQAISSATCSEPAGLLYEPSLQHRSASEAALAYEAHSAVQIHILRLERTPVTV